MKVRKKEMKKKKIKNTIERIVFEEGGAADGVCVCGGGGGYLCAYLCTFTCVCLCLCV